MSRDIGVHQLAWIIAGRIPSADPWVPFSTDTPLPTHTPRPRPTDTPRPVHTSPAPTTAPSTPDQDQYCLDWSVADQFVGNDECVCGFVTDTHDSGKAFFVNFTDDWDAFYIVMSDYLLYNVEGEGLCFAGRIELYEGKAQIVVRYPSWQLATRDEGALPFCGDTDGPCWDFRE